MTELSIIVKATILLIAGLTAAFAARKSSAAVRHVVLACTFGALIVLPPAFQFLPAIEIPVFSPPGTGGVARSAGVVAHRYDSTSAAPTSTHQDAAIPTRLPSRLSVIRGLWAIVSVVLFVVMGAGWWRFSRIRRRALPWLEGSVLVRELAASARIRRRIDVLLTPDLSTPLTYGVRRPAILLPMDAGEWSEGNLRRALIHEMEHLRRHDWTIHLLSRAACALYWFHPLAWIAWRQLCLESERACDDAVLQSAEGTEYADQLVQLARRMSNGDEPALAMANRSDLAKRVAAILDHAQHRGRAGILTAVLSSAAAVVIVFTLAPMVAVSVPMTRTSTVEMTSPTETESPSPQRPRSVRLDRALLEAAQDGDLDGMRELVSLGADVNAAIRGDGSPLIVAAREAHIGAVEFLLSHGADPNLGVRGDGNALIMAAAEGHLAIVALLLNRGARIDEVVPGDENALIQASGAGHLAVVQLLVSRGANVNMRVWVDDSFRSRSGEWRTPLNQAQQNRRAAVVNYLLSVGARPE